MTQPKRVPNSLAVSLALLPERERIKFLKTLSDEECAALLWDWQFWARPLTEHEDGSYGGQIAPPGDWATWLVMAGRGYGKTRIGAEWIRGEVESERRARLALVGRTAADVRDVMVEGPTGILQTAPPWNRPKYEPSKRRLTWENGVVATTFSADEPDLLRGPQFDGAWCDEIAAWRFDEAWDNLQFGLRLGDQPRCVCTTTPKPVKLIRNLIADSHTVITRGSSYENRAHLAKTFFGLIVAKYEGTRLGRQELNAELLDDTPGALWTRSMIEQARTRQMPDLARIVVAIDPPASSGEESAEAGIIVAGIDTLDVARAHVYVLEDLSLQATPLGWASQGVAGFWKYRADRIVGEQNNGGEMVESTLRTVDPNVSYKAVWAARGKVTRAEPVSSLYEQKRVHHVGAFAELEDQMCTWIPGDKSPDRMDALVWAVTELVIREEEQKPPKPASVAPRIVRAREIFG